MTYPGPRRVELDRDVDDRHRYRRPPGSWGRGRRGAPISPDPHIREIRHDESPLTGVSPASVPVKARASKGTALRLSHRWAAA